MSDLDWIETRATQRGDTLDWLAQAVERKAGEERGNEDGSFSFIASTGSVDRMGDSTRCEGITHQSDRGINPPIVSVCSRGL